MIPLPSTSRARSESSEWTQPVASEYPSIFRSKKAPLSAKAINSTPSPSMSMTSGDIIMLRKAETNGMSSAIPSMVGLMKSTNSSSQPSLASRKRSHAPPARAPATSAPAMTAHPGGVMAKAPAKATTTIPPIRPAVAPTAIAETPSTISSMAPVVSPALNLSIARPA